PTLWVMAPLRHAAVRRLLDDREPGGGSDAASTTTAGGSGIGNSPVVLAAEGLAQAVQPLLTSSRGSETASGGGSTNGGGGSPKSEHRNRKGYRSDPDEPQPVLHQPSALAPAGTAEVIEMGGGVGGEGGGVSGVSDTAAALFSGAKHTVKGVMQTGFQAGHALSQQLRPRATTLKGHRGEGETEGEGEGADLEQGIV
ncbi:hypothetical protein Vretimale_11535, partial [Volvox reticuliferus]